MTSMTMSVDTDNNSNKLYQAILNLNEPLSVVSNALGFNNNIPALTKSGTGALTPPLSNHFD